jgi:short-subunit dehydrogenase
MRRQGWGKIVNVSSMGGKLVFPGGGFYHGTKYAVEAISDALRWEVRGFGVDVVIIEPGLIKTEFGNVAAGSVDAAPADGPYGDFTAAVARATKEAYEGGLPAKLGGGPETVARKIEKAITKRRPKPRYSVTASAKLAIAQRRLLTDRMWDGVLRSQFPQPGRG